MVLERFPPFEDSESEKKISDLEAPPAYENHMAVPYSPPPYEASSSDCVSRMKSAILSITFQIRWKPSFAFIQIRT